MQVIQLAQIPSQQVKCVLSRQQCTITVQSKYNKTFFSLKNGTTDIINGIICYPNETIIKVPLQNFSGNFIFIDIFTTEKTKKIDWEQFQTRYFLCYVTNEEYPRIGGE